MPLLDERYDLGALLGAGGMADVFEARDLRLGRRVAVKRLKQDLPDRRAHERFAHEGRLLATVVHPNTVTVYDTGETGDRPYIVMEYVDGTTLAATLARRGPLPADETIDMVDQVLAALEAVHDAGIVHRDLKPTNILLGNDGVVKLTDFGIAKLVDDATAELTTTGHVVGTAKYMAPEVARGEPATPKSDLYSVGLILREMLTQPPDTASHAIEDIPTRPIARAPEPLLAVADIAADADPTRRFDKARDMRAALAALRSPEVAPTRVLPLTNPPRPPRRQSGRTLAVTAALALAAIGVAAALSTRSSSSPSFAAVGNHPGTSAATTLAPSTTPSTAVAAPPQTLAALIARLRASPAAFGTKAGELLDRLQQLSGEPPGHARRDAANLAADVDRWVARGELDPNVGASTTQLLATGVGSPAAEGDD